MGEGSVLKRRRMHILCRRKTLKKITNWANGFSDGRSTIQPSINITERVGIRTGIPERSLRSPILYLCCNANLQTVGLEKIQYSITTVLLPR